MLSTALTVDIAPDQRTSQAKDFTNRWGLSHVEIQTPMARIARVQAKWLSRGAACVRVVASVSFCRSNSSLLINKLFVNETY